MQRFPTNYLPVKAGEKKPDLTAWVDRMAARPANNAEEVAEWLSEGKWLGAITGGTSGGLCLLDFDKPGVFDQWKELVPADLLERVAIVSTRREGCYHVWFRTTDWFDRYKSLDVRIAQSKVDKAELLIEFRRGGKYGVVPSPTCDRYQYVGGLDVETAPVLSPEDSDTLVNAARSFNQVPKKEAAKARVKNDDDDLPGNDYSKRHEPGEIVSKYGWELVKSRDGVNYWRRPGKKGRDHSATEHYVGPNVFYVFSSDAAPLEADTSYDTWALRAIYEFGGDFKKCAAALREEGYGNRSIPHEVLGQIEKAIAKVRNIAELGVDPKPPAVLEDLLADIHEFKRSWGRRRTEFGGDRRRYDLALLYYLRRAGCSYEETLSALYLHRKTFHDDPDEILDVAYIAPRVHLIDKNREDGSSEEDTAQVVEREEVESKPPADALETVNKALKLDPKIERIVKWGAENSRWELHMADGVIVRLGTIDTIDDPRRFRRVVGDQLRVGIRAFTMTSWNVVYCAILRAAEELEDNDGDDDEVFWSNVMRFYRDRQVTGRADAEESMTKQLIDAVKSERPVIVDGVLYLASNPLLNWLKRRGESAGDARDITPRLRRAGFVEKRVKAGNLWKKHLSADELSTFEDFASVG